MFEGQPKSLYALALANTGERFGYYTMIAVFALFLRGNFGLEPGTAGAIYSSFLGLVYFLPLVGGILADKFGYGKMVTTGIMIMFVGYLCLAIPLGTGTVAFSSMLAALLLISLGTGLFKGNLQVMVGNLYEAAGMESKRDSGFSIFYMAINIGALFAPTAAVKIHEWGVNSLQMDSNSAYHLAFAVACVSLIFSIAIYYIFRPGFKHLEGSSKKKDEKSGNVAEVEELSPSETKERIVALCLVFAVVIFFWMAFHQNGLTLTYFADEFIQPTAEGAQSMAFDVINLFMVIIIVYAGFAFFGANTGKTKGISALVILCALAVIGYKYSALEGSVAVSAPIFQQFNPFYVVALTPVSMAIFGALARKGKEPTAPRKIAYGMLIAGCGFLVMLVASMGLNTPDEQKAATEAAKTFASPNWLIGTYLVLTFGELLLSPMGISFVSKVAPPKYKGAMMGGWFVATALGNLLVSVGGFLWGGLPLTLVWGVFIVLCILSAFFMFAVMGKLEKVAK
ncbi:peptide MFS transporter [Prevotella aurantiaca]|jgi:amino acid/peptide transporter|uniref:peptide MFS transporter n=1 Tax=Prevotella aurantiaca TaxID=596085 RepID=UPI001CAB1475|nr:peptide MFS transporter [Prevotella aurantiaca]MBF1385650.1 peptide MFS transporter [Prevotella aurantiaca]